MTEQTQQPEDTKEVNKSQVPQKEKTRSNVKEQYERDRGADKEQIHVVVIGHVDAGTIHTLLVMFMGNQNLIAFVLF